MRSGEPVVVGVSGGADSVVLAALLRERGHPLTAVHVNFNLRGTASDEDEAFVRSWCRERGVPLVVRSFETKQLARERGTSLHQVARTLRYDAFEEVAASTGCRRIALGHHRDDQAETLLLNLFRGTGPEGLAGMPVRRPVAAGSDVEVVRPLLGVRRSAIEDYARACGLAWREDASNTNHAYRRGVLRAAVLPLLKTHFGEAVVENVARSADLMRDYLDASLEADLQAAFSAALRERNGEGVVALAEVDRLPPVLRRRLFIEAVRRWLPGVEADAQSAAEIDELTASQVGRRLEFGGGTVWRERERLLFVPDGRVEQPAETQLAEGRAVALPRGLVRAERLPHPPDDVRRAAPHDVYVDARAVRFPLTVRAWRAGDRFVPLGMKGTKKLSDFLTDERVPPHRREQVAVVESNGKIVWVIPLRIAEHVRLRDDSLETIHLSYVPDQNTGEHNP